MGNGAVGQATPPAQGANFTPVAKTPLSPGIDTDLDFVRFSRFRPLGNPDQFRPIRTGVDLSAVRLRLRRGVDSDYSMGV